MRTTMKYWRLGDAEREEISRGLASGIRISAIARQLNDRPRKVLHYEKPDEVFNQLVALKV